MLMRIPQCEIRQPYKIFRIDPISKVYPHTHRARTQKNASACTMIVILDRDVLCSTIDDTNIFNVGKYLCQSYLLSEMRTLLCTLVSNARVQRSRVSLCMLFDMELDTSVGTWGCKRANLETYLHWAFYTFHHYYFSFIRNPMHGKISPFNKVRINTNEGLLLSICL